MLDYTYLERRIARTRVRQEGLPLGHPEADKRSRASFRDVCKRVLI